MICVPQGASSSATLEAAAEAGHDGVLGPCKLVVVAPISVHGRELKRQLPCLLLDLAVAGLDLLSLEPRPGGSPVTFGTHRLQSIWPHPRRIVEALEDYLNGEDLEPHERLEPYLTAEDEEVDENGVPDGGFGGIATAAPGEDVLQQLLAATSSNAAVLGGLQTRLDSLDGFEERLLALEKQPPRPSTVPASGPAQGPAWAPQLFAEGETAQLEPGQVQQLLARRPRSPHFGGCAWPFFGAEASELSGSSGRQRQAETYGKAFRQPPGRGCRGGRRRRGHRGRGRAAAAPCTADCHTFSAGGHSQKERGPIADVDRQQRLRGRPQAPRRQQPGKS